MHCGAPEHRNEDVEQHDVGKQKVDPHHGEAHQPPVFDRTPRQGPGLVYRGVKGTGGLLSC